MSACRPHCAPQRRSCRIIERGLRHGNAACRTYSSTHPRWGANARMTAFFCGVRKARHGSAHLKFPAVSWVSAHLKAGSCSGKICVAHSALRHVDFRSTSCDCVIEHLATFVRRKFCSIASEYIPYYTGWCQEAVLSSVKAPRILFTSKGSSGPPCSFLRAAAKSRKTQRSTSLSRDLP